MASISAGGSSDDMTRANSSLLRTESNADVVLKLFGDSERTLAIRDGVCV